MPERRWAPLLLLAALSFLASCGGEDESLTGTWTGAVRDSLGNNGGTTFVFSQSSSDLGGVWEVNFVSPFNTFNTGGTLTGKVEGNSISATLMSRGPCSFSLAATRSGSNIRGSYSAMGCDVVQKGTLDLERRP
jgi:hypothetical protein